MRSVSLMSRLFYDLSNQHSHHEASKVPIREGLMEKRGLAEELIDGEMLSRLLCCLGGLGLRRTSMGRADSLPRNGEGLGGLLATTKGEGLLLPLSFCEGLAACVMVSLRGGVELTGAD